VGEEVNGRRERPGRIDRAAGQAPSG
jgi:hypothetical protein